MATFFRRALAYAAIFLFGIVVIRGIEHSRRAALEASTGAAGSAPAPSVMAPGAGASPVAAGQETKEASSTSAGGATPAAARVPVIAIPQKSAAPAASKDISAAPAFSPPETESVAPIPTSTPPAAPIKELPPLDEDALMRAVVRIHCQDVYGSGFVATPDGLVITAAHVVMNAIDANDNGCEVIFPRKHPEFGYYATTYYRVGVIYKPAETETLYKKQGIDIAALQALFLKDDPVFSGAFPFVDYPLCGSDTMNDPIVLYGYTANNGVTATAPGSLLSRYAGGVFEYGDINGVIKKPASGAADGFQYLPDFSYTSDESALHPLSIIYSSNNYAGASGGLVFDTAKRCVVGIDSAVGTMEGDARIFGFVVNPFFSVVRSLFSFSLGE